MKSELLKQAMMAKYQDGGKVKKEPKKVASESELPKGGTWETDASGKKFYVVRSKDKTKGDSGKEKLKTYSGAKKRIPTSWKSEPTKSETEERFYLEPTVTKEPAPDPFNLAFGWAGAKKETTNEGVAANMPRVMINGKPTQIREWTIPGQFDEKTKTWNTASGAMNPTKVYGYYGANNEFIPVDVNKTQKLSYDPTGKPYYDPKDVVAPPTWTTAAKNEGSLRALDSEAIKKTQLANEEQRKNYLKSGEVAPPVQVKNVISPTNFNESGLSIGKDVELKTKAQGIVPTQGVNTPTVGQYDGKLEPLVHPKFKKGGLVGKYAGGGPIVNPNVKYGDSKLYTQQTNKGLNKLIQQQSQQLNGGGLKLEDGTNPDAQIVNQEDKSNGLSKLNTAQTGNAFSALGQLGGTGVDALDRKDGVSSIGGQTASTALTVAGQGAAIGSVIPGVGTVAGAVIGGGIGAIVGYSKGQKERKERIGLAADDVRNNVVSQQYSDSKATFKSDLYNEKDYRIRHKGLKDLFAKGGNVGDDTKKKLEKSLQEYNKQKLEKGRTEWQKANDTNENDNSGALKGMWEFAQLIDPTPITNVANMGVNKLLGKEQQIGDYAGVVASMIPYAKYGMKGEKLAKPMIKRLLEYTDKGEDAYGLAKSFAKGGTIKGAGTGTSDSIKTKIGKEGIEENSFIVPAKNNGLAKLIRKEVLEDSPNKEAKFKKGGNANIAVSNGEHLFTPAEKKKITAYLGQEILEKLAPEAEDGEDKAYGGLAKKYAKGGLTMSKAKEILRDGEIRNQPLTDKQKGYFGAVAGGNAYRDGGNVTKGTTVTVGNEQATWNGTNWVDKTGNKYSASYAKKFEDVISSNQQKEQQRLANQQASKYNTYKRKLAEAKADTKYDRSSEIANLQKFIDEYEGKSLPKVEAKSTPKAGVQKIVPTTTQGVPASTKTVMAKPSKNGLAKITDQVKFDVPEVGQSTSEEEMVVVPGSTRTQFDPTKVVPADARPDVDVTSQIAGGTVAPNQFGKSLDTFYTNKPTAEEKSKYGLADAIGMGAATLQAGYGLQQLMKDKRPIDKLDPAFSTLTDEAIAASKYGYSPAQKALLNQQITQGRIGQQAQINQLSGGNAAVGLANSRAAINSEMNKRLQMASEDERLRAQKAQYAAGLAGTRAQMSRQLFADKMNQFQQNQAAGAELLGAGLGNIVSGARYAQEKQAQDQINKLMFGSQNIV